MSTFKEFDSLVLEIEELLINGPKDLDEDDFEDIDDEFITEEEKQLHYFQSLRNECELLINKYELFQIKNQDFIEKVKTMHQTISETLSQIPTQDILSKIEHYLALKYKIQLLTLAKSMYQLEKVENVLEIPSLILNVISNMPKVIFEKSKIRTLVLQVCKTKKQNLLQEFHDCFDVQFNDTNNTEYINQTQMWSKFLKQSREYLLAYSLVSILPATLSSSSSSHIIFTFQEALDEALTPLWGRFYSHLEMARDSHSQHQIIWTFDYAKSFIEMICNLLKIITNSKSLMQLHKADYYHAAELQAIEKSVKIFRAHIALLMGFTLTINQEKFLMQLTEEILDFDIWLTQKHHDIVTLSNLIFESKEYFHRWMLLERKLILKQFSDMITPSIHVFENAFPEDIDQQAIEGQAIYCYQSIFHCLTYFRLAKDRYQYFPPQAQLLLSEVILEPILCLSLGLLLYRIRSQKELFEISIGNPVTTHETRVYQILTQFCDTVSYFQNSLPSNTLKSFTASSSRCKRKWTIIQNWIPKILITDKHQTQGFGLVELLQVSMKLSDKFQDETAFLYRKSSLSQEDKKNTQDHSIHDPVDTIEDCITLIRGLAITLVNVIESQLNNN